MRNYQIENYKRVGWVDSNNKWLDSDTNQQELISHAYDDYFSIAAICMRAHLFNELDLCRPKLIIAFGARAYQMIHSDSNLTPLTSTGPFGPITGLPMHANTVSPSQFDHRHPNFKPYNVIHLYHPSTFVRTDEISPEIMTTHEASLVKTRAFMSELGLS